MDNFAGDFIFQAQCSKIHETIQKFIIFKIITRFDIYYPFLKYGFNRILSYKVMNIFSKKSIKGSPQLKNEKNHGFQKNIQQDLFIFENEFLETSYFTRAVLVKLVYITMAL